MVDSTLFDTLQYEFSWLGSVADESYIHVLDHCVRVSGVAPTHS